MARFATGVTVVTAERATSEVCGMTANSFTSVSLEPLLVLVCIDERAQVLPLVLKTRRFGVSVLRADQAAWSEYFAQPDQARHEEERLGVRFVRLEDGTAVLDRTLVQAGCRMVASHVSGDHTIVIGEVSSLQTGEGEPLLFYGGQYRRVAPVD